MHLPHASVKLISKGESPSQQRRARSVTTHPREQTAPSVKVAGVARRAACWRPIAFHIVLAMAAAVVHGASPAPSATLAGQASGAFQNPGVYSQIVGNLRFEWIPTREVGFQILPDGKVKIVAPLTQRSSDGKNECRRFIYDHSHNRLSRPDADALFGDGLALPVGNYGFNILWIKAATYDEVLAGGWTLTNNPDTYRSNSTKPDYFYLSIVPIASAPAAPSAIQEVVIPYDLQRVSWLPHYQLLPYDLNLPDGRGFGITRMLMDIPLEQVYRKVTQIQYMYGFLDSVPMGQRWKVLRAYKGEENEALIKNAAIDKSFGYLSQMDEDFGALGEKEHLSRAQEVLKGIYARLEKEKGVTSPNQTRMYDDYFTDLGGYSNSENFRFDFKADRLIAGLASEAAARKRAGGKDECNYFKQGAYAYRNWMQGGYLDSFERIPEGLRVYNEIYNFEKRFMAAPDRKVAKMGWTNAEGVNSNMYRAGTDWRLHFPDGDILRSSEVAWPFHMMLNESFWTLLLGHDYYLWHSSVPMVSDIAHFGDSWAAGAGKTRWQPTGGAITEYDPKNPAQPQRTKSPKGQFPTHPHLGESGAFTGAWLVSQLTTASERLSKTIEYCPFTYKVNGGSAQAGYFDSDKPAYGSLGNAKLSRPGIANYGQANIVKSYEAKKPICLYTEGADGAALIYHNVYGGLAEVDEVTVNTPLGERTFQVAGNSLHVFYVK
ncbi:MAG: hypothetical protein JWL90_361 [Chthoniobacteraceae bacterium]|nr:hypothetical protein [Chthoniobacteraceae bacterium]